MTSVVSGSSGAATRHGYLEHRVQRIDGIAIARPEAVA
jgi:hypothetical protein